MQSPKNKPKSIMILALAAFIWGVAFVFQSEGGDAAGPLSFSCIRASITSLCLLLLLVILKKTGRGAPKPATARQWKDLLICGAVSGLCLYGTSVCQQLGMYLGTPVGKAGFITACYIVLVPILGLIIGKKCGKLVWIAVALAVAGLYFLCLNGSFSLQLSDLLVMGAALSCAVHILAIDRYIDRVDTVQLSFVQFTVCALLGIGPMLGFEIIPQGLAGWGAAVMSRPAVIALLYTGVCSGAIAYTLQIVGQKGCEPAVASIVMSLESVFSVLAGWVLLGQKLSSRELLGCLLILGAVILAQLPEKNNNA